jgi:hypothetical protein
MESTQRQTAGAAAQRINRVPSGGCPLLHIVSGEVPLRIHAMKWYSTAVQLRTAQLCTVVRRRPHSAALNVGMWGFSFLLRQKSRPLR